MGKFGKSCRIANSDTSIYGDMICNKCKCQIKGDYLVVKHYESSRGNEDDYNELFCHECSKDRTVWKNHYSKVESDVKARIIAHSHNVNKAIKMIKNSTKIEFTKNEYGDECIIIS